VEQRLRLSEARQVAAADPARGATAPRTGASARRAPAWLGPACLIGPALAFLLVFYVVPFAQLVVESLHPTGTARPGTMAAIGTEQYARLFGSGRMVRALQRTVWMSALTTVLTLAVAYPLALLLLQVGRRVRTALLTIVFVSLASSLIVRNYGWLVTLSDAGPVNVLLRATGLADGPVRLVYSEGATIVALVHYAIPFMVLPIFASLLRIPASLRESAQSLGASPWTVLRQIVWPLSMPGVFGGTVLTFSLSMSAFVTPLMLGDVDGLPGRGGAVPRAARLPARLGARRGADRADLRDRLVLRAARAQGVPRPCLTPGRCARSSRSPAGSRWPSWCSRSC
jgi:ABC-type spermidine/putrescine transport system permease subunit I